MFAVIFPFVVLGVFIWLLVSYPGNLYSPWQYTSEVGVEAYTATLSRQFRTTSKVYSEAALSAFTSPDGTLAGQKGDEGEVELAERIERFVRNNSITVDRSKMLPDADPIQIPVTEETTVADLLDAIYFEIASAVHPFTYGSSWLLRSEDGDPLTDIGTHWAGHKRDERMLEEVGITPGRKLWAEPRTWAEPRRKARSALSA